MKNTDLITRTALWRATGSTCFYCRELLSFRQLDVDHIIPKDIGPAEFQKLTALLGLDATFTIDCLRNLVPSHHDCNMRKSDTRFSESSLRFYLETWSRKQPAIDREIASLRQRASIDEHLTPLGALIERGVLSSDEVTKFFAANAQPVRASPSEPIVVAFGINFDESGIDFSPGESDKLEAELKSVLSKEIPGLQAQTEESLRTGETLSVRIAFWNIDLNRLEKLSIKPWEILEVARHSEIYEAGWEELFPSAVVGTYQAVIHDDADPVFYLGRCPQCGSKRLERTTRHDTVRDEQYYFIKCGSCGWSDWTQ